MILNMPVPQVGQTPFIALRPLAIVTSAGLFISRFALHFTQYASTAMVVQFLIVSTDKVAACTDKQSLCASPYYQQCVRKDPPYRYRYYGVTTSNRFTFRTSRACRRSSGTISCSGPS